jgi:hypothetical protein
VLADPSWRSAEAVSTGMSPSRIDRTDAWADMHIRYFEKAAAAGWHGPGYFRSFHLHAKDWEARMSNYAITVRAITNKRFGR